MAFLVTCFDKKDSLELRLKTREEHIRYIKKIKKKLLLAGPILDKNENPIGTVLVLNFDNTEMVNLFLKNDPYSKVKLFKNIKIIEFKKVL